MKQKKNNFSGKSFFFNGIPYNYVGLVFLRKKDKINTRDKDYVKKIIIKRKKQMAMG